MAELRSQAQESDWVPAARLRRSPDKTTGKSRRKRESNLYMAQSWLLILDNSQRRSLHKVCHARRVSILWKTGLGWTKQHTESRHRVYNLYSADLETWTGTSVWHCQSFSSRQIPRRTGLRACAWPNRAGNAPSLLHRNGKTLHRTKQLDSPAKLSDNKADMKKVPSRQFQKQFGKLTERLKPGDVVQVTKFGEPLVQVTRLGRRRVVTPDFAANLAALDYSEELGDQVLKEFNDSLS